MNKFQEHLNQLTSDSYLLKQSLSWSHILIIEENQINHGNFKLIPRHALLTPEQYATRFDEHLKAGYSWININAAGVFDDVLLIVIELPNYFYVGDDFKNKVSINFSGPSIYSANYKIID